MKREKITTMTAADMQRVSTDLLGRALELARQLGALGGDTTALVHELEDLLQQWGDSRPLVTVIGAFSSGKSTLLNRLLGLPAVPVSRTPTTAVATVIRQDERRRGVLRFRERAELTLLRRGDPPLDTGALTAMIAWLSRPGEFHVKDIHAIGEAGERIPVEPRELLRVLLRLWEKHQAASGGKKHLAAGQALVRRIDPRPPLEWRGFDRAFEVRFRRRPDAEFLLDTEDQLRDFGRHITDPALALTLHRVTLFMPEPRLRHMTFLDTAGLCSPMQFHKEVTLELLERRTDKLLVLLDARRLETPTNDEGLRVLQRFIRQPDDYRRVTFLLTFWDLALRTHMVEDTEPPLAFEDAAVRRAAWDRFLLEKKGVLAGRLEAAVGVPCGTPPRVLPLGLGPAAPPEMRTGVEALWKHLIAECDGWVGLNLWRGRWEAAGHIGGRLQALHAARAKELAGQLRRSTGRTDLEAERRRIMADLHSARAAVGRARGNLKAVMAAQRESMLTTIAGLDSSGELERYSETRFNQEARAAARAIEGEIARACAALQELGPLAGGLRPVVIDKQLIGLSDEARSSAISEVSGFWYGAGAVWDFFFGAVASANDGRRAAARRILSVQARSVFEVMEQAVAYWPTQLDWLARQIEAHAATRLAELEARLADHDTFVADLARRAERLRALGPSLRAFEEELGALLSSLSSTDPGPR